MAHSAPAIVILGNGSLATARKIAQLYPGALIHGLAARVEGADRVYHEFGATLRELYQQDTPIIALCAAGIVIRTLAPLLLEKGPSHRCWPWLKTVARWCRCLAASAG